ncbi:MAG: MotA/TolQ/ExbB proton channel family protein [Phycisphaerae bacterium]|nr:MotA/TolQ/ExbB proton channel family protein [Phycisphaerae bacterium]MCZ2401252.1 MotA/TolQ/ExbB proton channel family protein [Phycisphaerae bacterium]
MLMAATGAIILAQSASGGPAASAAQINSLWDLLVKGGPMMIPIGICSLVALAVLVERLLVLRRSRVMPPNFLPGLAAALGRDRRDTESALAYCRQADNPIANILAAALRRIHEPPDRLEKQVEQAGEREMLALRKHLRTLSVIVGVAPMLGLLGTVFGMIEAFRTVASAGEALGQTEALAKGIYEALITTAAGLLVAIPAMIAYHWIAARVERLVTEMDAVTVDFVEGLCRGAVREPAAAARASGDGAPTRPADVAGVAVRSVEAPSAA